MCLACNQILIMMYFVAGNCLEKEDKRQLTRSLSHTPSTHKNHTHERHSNSPVATLEAQQKTTRERKKQTKIKHFRRHSVVCREAQKTNSNEKKMNPI